MPKSRKRKPRKLRASGDSTISRPIDAAYSNRHSLGSVTIDRMISRLPEAPLTTRLTFSGHEAEEILHSCRLHFERYATSLISAIDPYTSLFYLRRIPRRAFEGSISTTGPYRRRIAEVLSTRSTSEKTWPVRTPPRPVIPPLNRAEAESLIELTYAASLIGLMHSNLRRAGKGQEIEWLPGRPPEAVIDDDTDLEEAIQRYDNRTANSRAIHAGTVALDVMNTTSLPDWYSLVLGTGLSNGQATTWSGSLAELRKPRFVTGPYQTAPFTIEPTLRILQQWNDTPWGSTTLGALLTLLRGMFLYALQLDDFGDIFSRGLATVGYIVVPSNTVTWILENALSDDAQAGSGLIRLPADGDKAADELLRLRPKLWPLDPGPPLRSVGDQTVVDMASASAWLDRLLTIDSSEPGSLVNLRSHQFEHLVQEAIDATPHAPPPEIRALRGVQLRHEGHYITDIDAIATIDRQALLVSCKSFVRSPELDAGVFRNVRNVRTAIEGYDKSWNEKVDYLTRNPQGSNYDLRGYSLRGITCTPTVEFVHSPQAREVLPGLAAVTSYDELKSFLGHTNALDSQGLAEGS